MEAGFLTKGFERFRAEKEKNEKAGGEAKDSANDEAGPQLPQANPQAFSGEIETVLRVFNGTVIAPPKGAG